MFEDVMQPTAMLPKLTDTTQTISFSDGDGVCSAEVVANNVVVTTNAGSHNHGSSKVKLKNLVDYNWEPKFYSGQLLAIHKNGQYLAYSIKAPNAMNPGTWSGMVRVVYNPEPGIDRRILIKGMNGEVQDLAFAHIPNQIVLACIDEQGNFYIHEIEATENKLRCTLLAEVAEEPGLSASTHRVVWCPYIPDEDDESPDDDVAWLLLTTHANMARMWNVRALAGGGGGGAGAGGSARAGEHAAGIAHAAFSPDGTALATAAHDGYVMFFQVYMNNESSPRCLHKWQPHGGKPLSCLFFLDNHKNYNTDVQFWKFAVTGAENNTTIKVWSCKSWTCLQTITFTAGLGTEASLGLKAQIDTSASYLILSDFKTRSLYVLNMARDRDDTMAYCKNISEFLLPYPVLSFCILDAEEDREGRSSSCEEPFRRSGSDGDVASPVDLDLSQEVSGEAACGVRVRVRLYIVQPKGLQEGELVYVQLTPPPALPLPDALHGLSSLTLEDEVQESNTSSITSSILQQQSQQLKNLLMRSQTQPGSLIGQRADSPHSAGPPLNLMTPDAFSSPGKRDEDDPPLSETPDTSPNMQRSSASGGAAGSSGANGVGGANGASGANGANGASGSGASGSGAGGAEPKPASGGSSPSLEVQQIMAHDEPFYKDEDETHENLADAANTSATNGDSLYQPEIFVDQPLQLNSSDTSWPHIPVVEASRIPSGEPSANVSLQEERAESAGAALGPPAPPAPTAPPAPPVPQPLSAADVARLDALDRKLDKLTELVSAQSRELRELRAQRAAEAGAAAAAAAAAVAADPREVLERALQEHSQRTNDSLNAALADGWERVVSCSEACGTRAAAAAGAGAARALEPLAAALRHELAAKLTATDHLLRENIDKLANSKSVMEQLSTAIAKSLSDMVRESFRSALQETVVPQLEKAHAQLFRQLNQAFQNGTKEFAANTEAAARAAAERGGAAGAAALRGALERHAEALAAQHAAHAALPANQHHLAAVIKDVAHNVLENELSWWREQARACAAASRAHSPAAPPTGQAAHERQLHQIQTLMTAGDVNGAFQLALSASDLALVVAACRSAEPARVFAPGALRHHVLLSLVQQLAADMQHDTVLKHRYLEEAIMNLDTSNPVTREHLPVVIRELQKQIVAFLNANPGHALTRQFKMLLMATESLVKSSV